MKRTFLKDNLLKNLRERDERFHEMTMWILDSAKENKSPKEIAQLVKGKLLANSERLLKK